MCGGGVRRILLLPLVARCNICMYMAQVSCVHPVAVLNAALCMNCSLLMLVEDARGHHLECLLLFTPSCCCECFYHF